MKTFKQNALLACALATTLGLSVAQAQQSEHDGHHPDNAPAQQAAPRAKQAKPQSGMQGGAMQGMDHDQMMQMHDQNTGKGQMMDHSNMGQGMDHRNTENSQRDKKPSKGNAQDKPHGR